MKKIKRVRNVISGLRFQNYKADIMSYRMFHDFRA